MRRSIRSATGLSLLLLSACSPPSGDAAASRIPPAGAAAQPPEVRPVAASELRALVREPGARAVLVNIWATWCMPCREEFPGLLRLRREHGGRGLRLLLVSGDFDSEMAAVQEFLAEQGVDFPTYIKAGKDMEFIDGLERRWSGALPATFLYDGGGTLRYFWENKASYETLEQRVLEVMNAGGAGPDGTAGPAGRERT
jgi:thiol-disulfide isomerase/thioredoxin